ncbi:unnamed protein product [Arctogadus glacialis]
MSSDMGASGGAGIGMPLMACHLTHVLAEEIGHPARSLPRDDSGVGGSPGAGELRRRARKDVVQGDNVIQGGDVVNLEALVGGLGVRNFGPEDVDGLSEIHRRGEKEVLGEEPLFRQLAAGGAGGGGTQGSSGVFSAVTVSETAWTLQRFKYVFTVLFYS